MEKGNNLLDIYIQTTLNQLAIKERHFMALLKNINGTKFIIFFNYKYDYRYIIELDGYFLDFPSPKFLAKEIYTQFLKDMGVKL